LTTATSSPRFDQWWLRWAAELDIGDLLERALSESAN
jgi:hypothetical protein